MAAKPVKRRGKGAKVASKISRTKRPDHMSLEEWQIALRRDFGRTQNFILKNMGDDPLFSEFFVRNSQSHSAYQGASPAAK